MGPITPSDFHLQVLYLMHVTRDPQDSLRYKDGFFYKRNGKHIDRPFLVIEYHKDPVTSLFGEEAPVAANDDEDLF